MEYVWTGGQCRHPDQEGSHIVHQLRGIHQARAGIAEIVDKSHVLITVLGLRVRRHPPSQLERVEQRVKTE